MAQNSESFPMATLTRMILTLGKGKQGMNGKDGLDGYTPVAGVDYPTDAQIDTKIAAALAERNQLEPLVAESAEWLNENGDPTKVYIVPNADGQGGKVYAYAEKTVVMEDKNVIPDAICGDDQTVGWVEGKGYSENRRLSSDGTVNPATVAGAYTTGFISCSDSDTVTVEHIVGVASGTSCYFIVYDSSKTKIVHKTVQFAGDGKISTANDWLTITDRDTNSFSVKLNTLGSGIQYFRFTSLSVENLAAYINKGSGNVAVVADWYAFTDFIPTEDARIEELDQRLSVVERETVGAVDMRTWDKPVYDTTPVVLIGDDTDPTKAKPAVGDRNTVQAVYDAYDALMAAHPLYVTRTAYKDKTADGQTLYRYDFKAPKPHEYSGGGNPDIVKPKIILISGIHHEMVGIWSLFHALEEIMTNPELRDIKRNAHLIVVPVCNPYCISGPYSETNDRKNANGVEIHRNFAVEHVVIDSASNNYGGPEPLSEIESRHIDSILAANTDAVAFISCHNFDPGGGSDYGTSFMWASTATNYLYNLGGRFGVKMSEAWEDQYGDTWRNQIDAIVAARKQYNKENEDTEGFSPLTYQPDGDYTVGMAGRSGTPGTEAKHCMLYGIHGMTFEVGGDMVALGGAAGDSVTVTRGAEVYANLIRTLLADYDRRDKRDYAPIPAGDLKSSATPM